MQQINFPETIFALSSGRLPAGVAVIRLSGPHVMKTVRQLCGKLPDARKMSLVRLMDSDGVTIDNGLVVVFPGPASFTGEDCAEFHLHGGRAVAGRLLEVLGALPGLRAAEAGEFTRRAFINGKMDLTVAEGLADLIDAETEAQRRFAIENSGGRQKSLYSAWRERIVSARALIEAELDFSDEEDVGGSVSDHVWPDIRNLVREIRAHAGDYRRAEIIREGFKVAIVGAPNAGKSSLLNALARRDVAIVSDEPGTTRDVVTITLDLDGVAVILSDTAGIREGAGKVEAIGIERSFKAAREADLVVELVEYGNRREAISKFDPKPVITVISKCDLRNEKDRAGNQESEKEELEISTVTGAGIDKLLDDIAARASEAVGSFGDVLPSRMRHISELKKAAAHLKQAILDESGGLEIRAEELRQASDHLGRIIGEVDVEDLLDVIFSKFCIGK